MCPCPYDHRETRGVALIQPSSVNQWNTNLVCPGSDRPKRGTHLRLVDLSIVPNYLKEPSTLVSILAYTATNEAVITTEYPANGSSSLHTHADEKKEKGQASRLISTSQLNASLRFHIWPINLVVYQEPLEVLRPGRSHLVEGFTLRCLQHFSHPDVATRRCHWRDNRYTRGPSNPVLSY